MKDHRRLVAICLIGSLLLSAAGCGSDPMTAPPLLGGLNAETAPTEPTIHIHDFSPATCTDPEICVTCGETQGIPTGHRWTQATCLAPVLCLNCAATKGSATEHIYHDDVCSFCGKSRYELDLGPRVWIGIHGGIKYHSHSGCSNMEAPVQIYLFVAEQYGFTRCQKCW